MGGPPTVQAIPLLMASYGISRMQSTQRESETGGIETPLLGVDNSSTQPQTIWVEPLAEDFTILPGEQLLLVGRGCDNGVRPSCNVVLWDRQQVQVYLESHGDFRVTVNGVTVHGGYQRELSTEC